MLPRRSISLWLALPLVSLTGCVSAFNHASNRQSRPSSSLAASVHPVDDDSSMVDRRSILQEGFGSVVASTFLAGTTMLSPNKAEAAVLSSAGCASGEGDACAELAGDNEFIKSLQKKSAEKKEQYLQEARNAYNNKNYPDYFASLSPPKFLVKKQDGTFNVYTESELTPLVQAGKIKTEIPKAMGGKVTDYSQKPIMVLIE